MLLNSCYYIVKTSDFKQLSCAYLYLCIPCIIFMWHNFSVKLQLKWQSVVYCVLVCCAVLYIQDKNAVDISVPGVMSQVNILLFVCRSFMMSEESWRRTETLSEMMFSTYSGRAGMFVFAYSYVTVLRDMICSHAPAFSGWISCMICLSEWTPGLDRTRSSADPSIADLQLALSLR